MAGSLIEINAVVSDGSSPTAKVTGIDSTYDNYIVTVNNATPETSNADLQYRLTEGGTANSTSNYDSGSVFLRSDNNTFDKAGSTNNDKLFFTGSLENDTHATVNGIIYLFNANNSSEYTYGTSETVYQAEDGTILGNNSGFTFTVTSAVDGVEFFMADPSSNIRSGARFVLFGLKK